MSIHFSRFSYFPVIHNGAVKYAVKKCAFICILLFPFALECACADAGPSQIDKKSDPVRLCLALNLKDRKDTSCDRVAFLSEKKSSAKHQTFYSGGSSDESDRESAVTVYRIDARPDVISVVSGGEMGIQTDEFYRVESNKIFVVMRLDYDAETLNSVNDDPNKLISPKPWFVSCLFLNGKLIASYSETEGDKGLTHPLVLADQADSLIAEYDAVVEEMKKK